MSHCLQVRCCLRKGDNAYYRRQLTPKKKTTEPWPAPQLDVIRKIGRLSMSTAWQILATAAISLINSCSEFWMLHLPLDTFDIGSYPCSYLSVGSCSLLNKNSEKHQKVPHITGVTAILAPVDVQVSRATNHICGSLLHGPWPLHAQSRGPVGCKKENYTAAH